jgi:hypothetical protein
MLLAGPYIRAAGLFLLFPEVFTLLTDEVSTASSASSHVTPFENFQRTSGYLPVFILPLFTSHVKNLIVDFTARSTIKIAAGIAEGKLIQKQHIKYNFS